MKNCKKSLESSKKFEQRAKKANVIISWIFSKKNKKVKPDTRQFSKN